MTAITLHRTDPAENMRRFYRLDVQPDLFGQWCFIREWGRIGSSGQARITPFPTPARGRGSTCAATPGEGAPWLSIRGYAIERAIA